MIINEVSMFNVISEIKLFVSTISITVQFDADECLNMTEYPAKQI